MQSLVISAVSGWKTKQNKIKMYMLLKIFFKSQHLFLFSLKTKKASHFPFTRIFSDITFPYINQENKKIVFKETLNEKLYHLFSKHPN